MNELRYTLLTDGSADQALMPILTWLLKQNGVKRAIQPAWADLRQLPRPPKYLHERIAVSVELYPCDLLFVHRDAERIPLDNRVSEIQQALSRASTRSKDLVPPTVCVVPVRMQEAWLLFDETALRKAAGNPNGTQKLNLPNINNVESLPNPKQHLAQLLQQASGLSGRRRDSFNTAQAARRLATLVVDFAPLRTLSAFQHVEADVARVVRQNGWVLYD